MLITCRSRRMTSPMWSRTAGTMKDITRRRLTRDETPIDVALRPNSQACRQAHRRPARPRATATSLLQMKMLRTRLESDGSPKSVITCDYDDVRGASDDRPSIPSGLVLSVRSNSEPYYPPSRSLAPSRQDRAISDATPTIQTSPQHISNSSSTSRSSRTARPFRISTVLMAIVRTPPRLGLGLTLARFNSARPLEAGRCPSMICGPFKKIIARY
jgi:hypothetical protein